MGELIHLHRPQKKQKKKPSGYLIASIPVDEEEYLEPFWDSIPNGHKKLWDECGYIRSFDYNFDEFDIENVRRLYLIEAQHFHYINTDYFAKTEEASISDVTGLKVIKAYIVHGKAPFYIEKEGSVNSMLNYHDLLVNRVEEHLRQDIKDKELQEYATEKGWFIKSKLPISIGVGIETSDQKYLLGARGPYGPYEW